MYTYVQQGYTAIHFAAYNGHREAVKLLLDRKACEVDCRSKHRMTPLHIACMRGNLELSTFLINRGADVLAIDGHSNTVLHYAASSNNADLLRHLLKRHGVANHINATNKVCLCIS